MQAVWVHRSFLSDGSAVFSVHLGNVEFKAVSESDAYDLAEKIADAVTEHSVDRIQVRTA